MFEVHICNGAAKCCSFVNQYTTNRPDGNLLLARVTYCGMFRELKRERKNVQKLDDEDKEKYEKYE